MSKYIPILILLLLYQASSVQAGGALEQRMQAIRQRRAAQQQAMVQQRAAQQAAVQRGAIQQTVAQQRAYQQAVVQQQAAATVSMRQQVAAQQNVAYRQALQNKIAQRMSDQQQYAAQVATQQKALNDSLEKQLKALNTKVGDPFIPKKVDQVLSLEDLWGRFESSSELWTSMIDVEPKQFTVAKYIEEYRKKGISIKKSPYHYVQLIDSMSTDNDALLKNPFRDIVRIVAVMEYDFDNGYDKDQLIKQMLGESGYQANRQRLGR